MPSVRNVAKLLDPDIRAKNVRAARLWARRRYWRLAGESMPDPVFVVGCSRAGTTVTYETVSAAPEFTSFGFELPQFWHRLRGPADHGWDSEAAYAEDALPGHRKETFAYVYAQVGKGWLVDKTCINTIRIPYLNALFPRARFVFIQRDGRDNVSSLIDGWRDGDRFSLRRLLGELPARVAIEGGQFDDWRFFLPPGWRDYNEASLARACAHQWISANQMALSAREYIEPERWIQLRYEDFFSDPVGMFARLFEGLGVPFSAALRHRCETLHERPTSVVSGGLKLEKWKSRNREAIESVLGDLGPTMDRLGYS